MPIDNGGQIRFMTENLLLTGVRSVTTSSEDADFPYVNCTTGVNANYRARPFKFAGRFQVTATNNKIYFHTTTDLVATITVGEYTTRALMAAAIQTAMNSVSSGWIVVWNTTSRKFSFTGPSHFFQLSNSLNSAWDLMGFSSVVDTTVGTVRAGEETRSHYPYEFIKWDFGYFPNIGFLGLIGDSAKDLQITPMASVIIEANTIDDFTSPPLSIELTRTNRGILKFFDDDDYCYRYWRLRIEDNFSPTENEIGYIYLGEFGKLKNHYNDQGGINLSEDRSTVSESESGQRYPFFKTEQRSYEGISFRFFDYDDKDFLKDIFKRYGVREPFFISIDPKLEITKQLDEATFFCFFQAEPRFAHNFGNRYSTDFKIKEWI